MARESQPQWKYITNLGDKNPIDYGGYFIYTDETGVYEAEVEYVEVVDEAFDFDNEDKGKWFVYRFQLEKCTYINGVLSENKFHPDHPAWFAQPESMMKERPQDTTYLSRMAECFGLTHDNLVELFCSDNVVERAEAYRMVGSYHGFDNLDSYPLEFTSRKEIEKRYKKEMEHDI